MSSPLAPPQPMSHFERLGLPETPDLTLEAVQRAFQEKALHVHPDRVGGEALQKLYAAQHTAALGDAYTVLKNPISRLLYLISLRTPPAAEIMQDRGVVSEIIALHETAAGLNGAEHAAFLRALQGDITVLVQDISALLAANAPDTTPLVHAGLRLRYLDKAYHDIEHAHVS